MIRNSLLFVLCAASVFAADRPYTLRTLDYTPDLYTHHNVTLGDSVAHFRDVRSKSYHGGLPLLRWIAPDKSSMIALSPSLAFDMRGGDDLGDTIRSYEGGVFIRGYKDSIDFWLDARMFTERHSADPPRSWDREFLDKQGDKDMPEEIKYSSYSRYRGLLNIRMNFGHLGFARDAPHWGPGYFHNLSLNKNAVPFNQMLFSTSVGPFTVISLYGDLSIADGRNSTQASTDAINMKSRNLYGHRYELNFGNTQIGINELTVLYNLNKPWLFVPIVPLFIEKGNFTEENNNGSLSIDFSQRLPHGFRVYSEFFIDDLQSPASLVRNEYVQAKWAWMAGLAYAGNFENLKVGSIAEYARVEPYVYSHFIENTAQIAHLGYPIGAPNGPNSQTINWLLYAKHKEAFQIQIGQEWAWKGTDEGSEIDHNTPYNNYNTPKSFLKGAKMKYSLTPAITYSAAHYAISTEYSFFGKSAFCSRIMLLW
ncbi:MAG: capsule assembly Wzi family protein [Fibromonadales bacterium]|nr:capsule assembly Wzi family protein [Fibromonadales bacterium]